MTRIYPSALPGHGAPTKTPPSGQRLPLPTVNIAGNVTIDVTKSLGLITARNLDWGPWAVTFDPMHQPNPQYGYNAPPQDVLTPPAPPLACGHPVVRMSWGVAGILRTVQFDYPIMGGACVVNANAVELSVNALNGENLTALGVQAPFVGAWITPSGAPAGPSSMLLSCKDAVGQANVPPFAKYFIVTAHKAPPAVLVQSEIAIEFFGPNIVGPIFSYRTVVNGGGSAGDEWTRVPVPPGAAIVQVSCFPLAAATILNGMWELSFC